MSVIVDFFVGFGEILFAIVNFVVDIVSDLIWFVGFLAELVPAMPIFFSWVPPGLGSMLGLTISVVVILRILGRGD